ncbi:hypothetical protein EV385_6655 [Krasilnikovia cinnamomea]|uniref:Uncharacterized protein n=1 Tax=Krasilnikovia cinnamomea TaxID=349313 RepID=A0A4Q7Z7Y6_9ACTN|nr:hypothetical protein [Krasilnikovia cinnamomea]RZU46580.1 hypothetical protein EV385_6655 [Krasilnikovia cinnamomea]
MTPGTGPRIIASAGELAAAAAAVDPAAPVYLEPDETEPGAEPDDQDTWVVLAQATAVPAGEDGGPAGPGERIAVHEVTDPDGGVHRHLASTTVLTLRSRHLATAGVIGPSAMPADPDQRRLDAFEDDDKTRYLMELVDAVTGLRDELADGHEHDGFGPAAWRRLQQAQAALEQAARHIDAATVYGHTCGLVSAGIVDDDQPCLTAHIDKTFVYIPALACDECGCPRHAAAVLAGNPDAVVTKISDGARATLAGLLPAGTEVPGDAARLGECDRDEPTA